MQKPNNYDNTPDGSFTPVELGGHYIIVKKLEETQSKSGKPMVKIMFDFCTPDKQEGYFMKSFKDDVRPEKKWPNNGTLYILTEDAEGKCSRNFKRFITAAEKSNNGFTVQWGDNFAGQFRDKKIGGVFGIVEDEYNGKVTKKRQLRWVCEWDAVATAKIPDEKLLQERPASTPAAETDPFGFMSIPDNISEEVPFL